jgi:hypothetical protein
MGKCSECGKTHYSDRKGDIVVCDCWRYCPICGAEMEPYTPDLAPKTYGMDGKRDLKILRVCTNHSPPFYSSQKPIEVEIVDEA